MKEKTQISTKEFETIEANGFSLDFRKTVKDGKHSVSCTLKNGENRAGFVLYDPENGKLTAQIETLEPSKLGELPALLSLIGESVKEIAQ